MRSFLSTLPLFVLMVAPLWGAEPATSLAPRAVYEGGIAAGQFGAATITRTTELPLILEADGQQVGADSAVILVEPGMPVVLQAWFGVHTPPADAARLQPQNAFIRQHEHRQALWQGEPDDTFAEGPDGTVTWRSGTSRGKASYVTAQVARLEYATPLVAGETPAAATLLHGRASVLLLSGVAYDRNGDGLLFGQNIGIYPDESAPAAPRSVADRAELYRPPITFYRVDAQSASARITPWLTLGQLAPNPFPEARAEVRYVPISPRLITFLTEFGADLTAAGLDPANLQVLRGFVSPIERQRLERADVRLAQFTRYQYGDAVAITYDAPASPAPRMQDLNKDGTVDVADADMLADVAKQTMDRIEMYGGLGVTASFPGTGPSAGTPHVQIDLRGFFTPYRE